MPTPASVGQRFAQLIKHLGVSKNAFAQSLGKTATVIQHLVDERNKPGYDLLCKVFEVYPAVSKDWLLLGQGPMFLPASPAEPAAPPRKAGVGAGVQTAFLTTPPAVGPEAAATDPPVVGPAAAPVSAPAAAAAESAAEPPTAPSAVAPEASLPTPHPAAEAGPSSSYAPPAEAYLTAALHAQHLQHQLALAEQRNQHLLAQQRLMQQLLDLTQRR